MKIKKSLSKLYRAPKVIVRQHRPWYINWLLAIGVLGVTFAAGWYGEKYLPHGGKLSYRQLTERNVELEAENKKLKVENARLDDPTDIDSRIQVERSAKTQLQQQLEQMTKENAKLKENLSFYDNVYKNKNFDDQLNIQNAQISSLQGQQYRLQVLLMQAGRKVNSFAGQVQLLVTVSQTGQKDQVITFPSANADKKPWTVDFKHYHRFDQSIVLPDNTKIKAAQVKVFDVRGQLKMSYNAKIVQGNAADIPLPSVGAGVEHAPKSIAQIE